MTRTRLANLNLSCAAFFFIQACQMRSSSCGALSVSCIVFQLTNNEFARQMKEEEADRVANSRFYFEGKYFSHILSSVDRIRLRFGSNRPFGIRGSGPSIPFARFWSILV